MRMPGRDLMEKWKKNHGSIKRAVLLTGTDIHQLETKEGIDKILPKVVDPVELIRELDLDKS